jgi:DHA1 family inner membrane transport protein
MVALAVGGFAIGTTEFVTMGLLPDIADGIHESIPTTGSIITAYAFGVVIGAPTIVSLGAHLPKRALLLALALALAVGNSITAVASGFWPLMAARFIAGLPHGAYFGVASLIAASLVPPEQRGRAVSSVMLGLAVATTLGVPLSTLVGQHLGWRSAYWVVVATAVLALAAIALFVPKSPGDHTASVGRELRALLNRRVQIAFATGMVGFGGMFAMYSYIAPTITDVTGLSRSWIPWFLFVFGLGAVFGTWLGGRAADWNVSRSIALSLGVMAGLLALFFALASFTWPAMVLVFLIEAVASTLAITLTVRLMHAAGDAQMIGAALNHSSLNIANGLGAFLGAQVVDAGFGYRAPSLVGVGLALAGLAIFGAALLNRSGRSGQLRGDRGGDELQVVEVGKVEHLQV